MVSVVRTIGIARARMKLDLANLAYNMRRFVWLDGRNAPTAVAERRSGQTNRRKSA